MDAIKCSTRMACVNEGIRIWKKGGWLLFADIGHIFNIHELIPILSISNIKLLKMCNFIVVMNQNVLC